MNAPQTPPLVYSSHFRYVRSAATDVQATWRRHGWKQPDPRAQAAVRHMLNRLA